MCGQLSVKITFFFLSLSETRAISVTRMRVKFRGKRLPKNAFQKEKRLPPFI